MILPQQYQHHPELRLLAQQLGQSRFASRAPSTIKSHQHRWQLFADWLAKIDSTAQPIGVQPALVALYLQKLTTESKADAIGPSRVLGASAAIACYHWFFGQPSPTQHPLCDLVREASRRQLRAQPLQRDPITAADLRLLIDRFATQAATLRDLMHVTVMALMYAGFLRFNDATHISVHEHLMVFQPTHVALFISQSKTDQHMEVDLVVIAKTSGSYCPVSLLLRGS